MFLSLKNSLTITFRSLEFGFGFSKDFSVSLYFSVIRSIRDFFRIYKACLDELAHDRKKQNKKQKNKNGRNNSLVIQQMSSTISLSLSKKKMFLESIRFRFYSEISIHFIIISLVIV